MSNKNDDFNFEEFASGAISSIDSFRSYMRTGGKFPTESRINSFYRALGLPCVVPENKEKTSNKDTNKDISEALNNGNVFSGPDNALKYDDYKDALTKRQAGFSIEISEEDTANFIKKNTQKITGSIDTDNGRVRGSLFPMVVDGSIPIYPSNRRVAGAFMNDSDLKHKQDVYRRPLIETILYIKLQGSGSFNSERQGDVSASFQSGDLTTLYNSVESNFKKTINSVVDYCFIVMTDLCKVRKETENYVLPDRLYNTNQNSIIVSATTKKGKLDVEEENIEFIQTLNKTILSLFEFNDVTGLSFARNLTDASLSNSLLDILNPEPISSGVVKTVDDFAERRQKVNQQLKNDFRGLDLLLGTFSGISGVDILAIMYALFKMNETDVMALLNEDAKTRLKTKTGITAGSGNVTAAIRKLQEKVTAVFTDIETSINNKTLKTKNPSKKSTGGK